MIAALTGFLVTLTAGLSLARQHTFTPDQASQPAPLDGHSAAAMQTATFALG